MALLVERIWNSTEGLPLLIAGVGLGEVARLGNPGPPSTLRTGARLRQPVRMCALLSLHIRSIASLHIRSIALLRTIHWLLTAGTSSRVLALCNKNAHK